MKPYIVWTSPDGLIGVELDEAGMWIRRREHPADQWEAPEQMLLSGGTGKLAVSVEQGTTVVS